MKKILFAVVAGLGIIGTSCNNNGGGSETLSKDATAEDSIAYYMGSMYAGMVKQQLMQGPDSAKFNVDEFLAGVKETLDVDTANVSRLSGMGLGMQFNQQVAGLAQQHVNLDKKAIYGALVAALKGDQKAEDPQNAQMQLQLLVQKVQREAAEKSPEAIQGTKAGEKYIADLIAKDPEVKKTASGVAYKVVKEGNGEKFTVADQIDVIYVGKHMDGKEFDNSNGEARTFSPAGVVPGFKEALCMMSPGAKYIVYIPGKLGYGPQGQPYAQIGPNELLIFEVETVGIHKADAAPEATPAN